MATLKDLARRMNRLADDVDEMGKKRKDRIATAILKALIDATPVDTSRALSNWRVGNPSPWIEAYYVGQAGSTQGASASQAMSTGIAAIKAGRFEDALVIFNAVPYIRKLNEGSSAQAPAGFIEKAILAGRLAARD